jgi:hypothetical protein
MRIFWLSRPGFSRSMHNRRWIGQQISTFVKDAAQLKDLVKDFAKGFARPSMPYEGDLAEPDVEMFHDALCKVLRYEDGGESYPQYAIKRLGKRAPMLLLAALMSRAISDRLLRNLFFSAEGHETLLTLYRNLQICSWWPMLLPKLFTANSSTVNPAQAHIWRSQTLRISCLFQSNQCKRYGKDSGGSPSC